MLGGAGASDLAWGPVGGVEGQELFTMEAGAAEACMAHESCTATFTASNNDYFF